MVWCGTQMCEIPRCRASGWGPHTAGHSHFQHSFLDCFTPIYVFVFSKLHFFDYVCMRVDAHGNQLDWLVSFSTGLQLRLSALQQAVLVH